MSEPVIDDLWVNRLVFLVVLELRCDKLFEQEVGEALEELCAEGRVIKLGPDLYKANRVKSIVSPV